MSSDPVVSPISVAFFCMEFALAKDFNIYSGGLGVLAGDYLYEADRKKFPVVGVGLYYSFSYQQRLSFDDGQVEKVVPISPDSAGLEPVLDVGGERLKLQIPLQSRMITVQAWKKTVGDQTPLYLLDTDVSENIEQDRHITDQLYSGDKEHRIAQEIVLGIGGARLLHRLNITPQIYHMNEGHSGFLVFQVIADLMVKENLTFEEAKQHAKNMLVFTNHTLIAAGNDIFSIDLVTLHLDAFAREVDLPLPTLLDLGRIPDTSQFSMTMLGLRVTDRANAVSKYHAEKAKQIWSDHPLLSITNGVYVPRWLSGSKNTVWPVEADHQPQKERWWEAHQQDKAALRGFVQEKTGVQIPEESLIFTWARRFVQYKRPTVLFWQLEWLENIIKKFPLHVHFLFAGKVHPHDAQGKKFIAEVIKMTTLPQFQAHITFVPNYNLEVAEYLVQGSDVWLNTPMEGYEACGTSGMKAALNGVLQCSTNDGWVREVGWKDIGWILDNQKISESLYSMIEHEIIPTYLQRDVQNLPQQWIERMITSSQIIRDHFSTSRMLEEYAAQLYHLPIG